MRKPSPVLWTVRLRLPADPAEAAEMALEPFALALSRYEVDGGKLWEVEALIEGAPDRRAIRAALAAWGKPSFERLPSRDWVAESRKALPPIAAGRFYLRGSHIEGPAPRGKLALLIDAGAAFGTGRHESTRGCLIALDRLARAGRVFAAVLDLGCGSGVLALAAARLWPGPVLAADNDPDAVRVARENVILNGLAGRVRVLQQRRLCRHGPPPRRPLRPHPGQHPRRPPDPHGPGAGPQPRPRRKGRALGALGHASPRSPGRPPPAGADPGFPAAPGGVVGAGAAQAEGGPPDAPSLSLRPASATPTVMARDKPRGCPV